MTIRPASLLGALVAFVAALLALLIVNPLQRLHTLAGTTHARPVHAPAADPLAAVLHAIALTLAIGSASAAAVAVVLLTVRTLRRRERDVVWTWLVPYRADEAHHEAVRSLLESWHQVLIERWWRRPHRGQPAITLDLAMEVDGQGAAEGRMLLSMPAGARPGLEGALAACYPDARLVTRATPPQPVGELVRLKKRHAFIRALRTSEGGETRNVIDALLSQMEQVGGPAHVQLALVPTPALFDHWSRRRFRSHERASGHVTVPDARDRSSSMRSEVVHRELEHGLVIQHRPLFFVDVRVGAADYARASAIAGTLRGESAGENRLVERHMRMRRALYRERMRRGWANPLPSWRHGVMSSSELAALWHTPSPGLTTVAMRRALVPRAVASPEIERDPRQSLMRDERGPVGIRARDKSDGLGLIGGQKTGKTSVLCRSVAVDAADDDCALVVLMPKPGDARLALSTVPPHRTVHYLDFERPEFGINPLLANGEVSMVADRIVDAFRDVVAEGDIRGSSDRYLRQAAQATIAGARAGALSEAPSLWHMYRMLLPSEVEFREHVVSAIYDDPRFVDTTTFFARDLPNDLRDALVNTTSKLDAPRNKILRLMVEGLDKVLRHPVQLSIDELIRNRGVLIVDGKMGTFGSDNCRVMMQFILSMLYGALQRQQQLDERDRVRLALKVDEAHLMINASFADALATLRSAGLEVVAAWQYGAQIEDEKIRSGMMSLLRQRCMFSMGEARDAREMSEIAMAVYTDMIREDTAARGRVRMTPDVFINMPNHHAMCTWIANGARAPSFIGQTIPMRPEEAIIEHHLEAQRERGGYVPDRLPNPFPDVGPDPVGDARVLEVVGAPAAPAPATPAPARDDGDEPGAEAGSGAPESYTELDLDDVRGIVWDEVEPLADAERRDATPRELEILAALWDHRHLFASQIHRRWWADSSLRACQQALTRMTRDGWVRRFRFSVAEGGAQQRVYCISHAGFELLQRANVRGSDVDAETVWREPPSGDPRAVLRDLHGNGWVLALHARLPKAVRGWRGPSASRIVPPRKRVQGDWIEMRPSDIPLGNRRLHGCELQRLEQVTPGATVELRLGRGERAVRVELLIELDRSRGAVYNEQKLRRYDLMLAGWFRMLDRYRSLGSPPVVVFVCEDERRALAYLRTADRAVTTRLARAGDPEAEWPSPARRHMLWVCERNVHEGSLSALALPELPPSVRRKLGDEKLTPRRVELIDPALVAPR
ncbi:MAG TPA: hypothetical protein VN635_01195 [Conexibacter sp.]|nr:hypothetical protein [Conexibacter sp.]